jgi:hypothetical protein
MSKMDDLRAMREARYAQAQSRSGQADSPGRPPAPKPAPARQDASLVQVAEADAGEALCGHRSISGRTCTRPSGHSAKSHRYA